MSIARPVEPRAMSGPAGHIPALDGLRGLAALTVMLSHLSTPTGLGAEFFQRSGGQIGVMVFFALSGFLMAHVYFRDTLSPGQLWRYAVARIARVVPLFIAVVVLSYLVTRFTGEGLPLAYPITRADLVDHLLLRRGESVLWTIPVELRFYALFPAFWLACRISPRLAGLSVAALLLAYFALPPGEMPVMKLGHYFLIGMAGWLVWRVLPAGSKALDDVTFLGAVTVLALLFPLPFTWIFGYAPKIWWEPQLAAAIFLVLLTAARSRLAGRILSSRPLRTLGDISYSLYLTHMLTIMNMKAVIDPVRHPALFYAACATVAVIQSMLIFRFVERPSRRAIRRLDDMPSRRRRLGLRAAPLSPALPPTG